jgi:hypothetical protein
MCSVEGCITKSLMICSTYVGEETYIQGFGGETSGKEVTCKTTVRRECNIRMDLQEVEWAVIFYTMRTCNWELSHCHIGIE